MPIYAFSHRISLEREIRRKLDIEMILQTKKKVYIINVGAQKCGKLKSTKRKNN